MREPLLHFLLAGALLYALATFLRPGELEPADDKLIYIDRTALLTYLQYQANAFDPDTFAQALDAMGETELQRLLDGYITEEVLYREATALGLEQSDYIIRQRMVDKMRFLLGDMSATDATPTDQELQAWLEQNPELYRIQASATFTHVFVDAANGDEAKALQLLQELNEQQVGFNDAGGMGDRFPFLRNYVERTLDFAKGHFGPEFVAGLEQLQPDASTWQGPLRSAYGYHLVLLTVLDEARDPALADVRTDVLRDYIATRSEERLSQLVQNLRDGYEVQLDQLQQPAAQP
jgi:hypothetical protein